MLLGSNIRVLIVGALRFAFPIVLYKTSWIIDRIQNQLSQIDKTRKRTTVYEDASVGNIRVTSSMCTSIKENIQATNILEQ